MKLRFGNGLLADFAKPQLTGKIDAIGVFTRFNAWGYPCMRNWTIVFTIFDIPENGINIHIGIKSVKEKSLETLSAFDIKGSKSPNNHAIPIALNYEFKREGNYEIIFSIKDHPAKLKIPVNITTLPWANFSEEEIEFVKKNRNIIPYKISAQINCNSCSHAYIFEESLITDEPPQGGISRFPENGIFECTNCGYEMNLKDIQGQFRASLKDNVSMFLKRLPNV